MLTINNQPTQDKYVEALTLGPAASAQKVAYLIANNAVLVQLAGHSDAQTIQPWGDELLLTPTTGEFQRIQGMRFKSAVPGQPAQVVAQLVEPGDPVPIGGTPFTQNLSSTGTISGGGGAVDLASALLQADPQANIDVSAATEAAPLDFLTCAYNANGIDTIVVSLVCTAVFTAGFNVGDTIGFSLWIDGVNTGRLGAIVAPENTQAISYPGFYCESGRFVPAGGARSLKIRAWSIGVGTKQVFWGKGGIGQTPSGGGMNPAATMRVLKVG